MHATVLALLTCALLTPCAYPAEPGDDLLVNGDFEAAAERADRPKGWHWDPNAQWLQHDGNHWVVQDADAQSISIAQTIPLREQYWKLRVSCRVRTTDVQRGDEGWHDARIAMQFQDADGDMVGNWPNVLHFVGSTDGWERHQREYIIPPGARQLSLSCSIFHATGRVEWDDVSVTLLKLDPVPEDAKLPDGVKADYSHENARKWQTPTRAKVCINGLWRFHPAEIAQTQPPEPGTGWGYHKVPGSWAPANSCMEPFGPDIWQAELNLAEADAAWYQRTITVPARWRDRRILINIDNPKHWAKVYVDGEPAGTIEWPGGEAEITELVTPGNTHNLSVFVLALPLEESEIHIARPDLIEEARKQVTFKGLCGDCYLESRPTGERITGVFLKPSVRRGGLTVSCDLAALSQAHNYQLAARIYDGDKVVKSFTSATFPAADKHEFFGNWQDPEYWDIDQPNLYQAVVELRDDGGEVLDETVPAQFGFREFWIDGRHFYLNGKRIHFRCLDLHNHQRDNALASYPRVAETLRRARQLGFNYVIHGNYDFEPQAYTYLEDLLRAGDDLGFPMSFSARHIKRIWQDFDDPEKREYWQRVIEYEVEKVRNHPCVFMWAMNHNFTGYRDDQNPAHLTGEAKYEPPPGEWVYRRRQAALASQKSIEALDPTRPCYHHQSGSLGNMYTLNCYLCFTPLQERIEWLSKWARKGIKPLFFVEFGLPHHASWGGHRMGPFIWRNNVSPEPLVQEYGAIYNGDEAYDLPQYAVDHYDTIERVYARGEPFHLSQVLASYWSNGWEKNFLGIKSLFTRHTWPAFRTWGISSILPWDQGDLFKVKSGAGGENLQLPTDWDDLQRPGISPDYVRWTADWLTTPDFSALEPTCLGETFSKLNKETLAYIAGPARRFTAKDHLFRPGETVEKRAVIVNDLRHSARFHYSWKASLDGRQIGAADDSIEVEAGGIVMLPIYVRLPAAIDDDTTGRIELTAQLSDGTGPLLEDAFDFTVLAPAPQLQQQGRSVGLFDPLGQTAPVLERAGLQFRKVTTSEPTPDCDLFIIGREAIQLDGSAPNLNSILQRAPSVLVFEQSEPILQRRWGFRTASPGTRRAFVRQPAHPICNGITDDTLRHWRGSPSLIPAYPDYPDYNPSYPMEKWCGFLNSRTWQWGNYGSVATALIEKPQRGNFSVILDCEFDQQYTPLLEWIAPRGRVIFSQIDFNGRDMFGPAPERLLANLLNYALKPPSDLAGRTLPQSLGPCQFVGSTDLRQLLSDLGVRIGGGEVAVLGPGASSGDAKAAVDTAKTVICIGLDGDQLSRILPFEVRTSDRSLVHTLVGRPNTGALVGLGNCDFHWRRNTEVPAITDAPPQFSVVDTGVFSEGTVDGRHYVLIQWRPDQFSYQDRRYLKRTWRNSVRALARILTNCGVRIDAPVAELLSAPPRFSLDLSGNWRLKADRDGRMTPEQLSAPGFDTSSWPAIEVPGDWESQIDRLAEYDGVAWYRKEFTLEELPDAEELTLRVGAVDDEDWTYLNGKLVGHIGHDTHPDNHWAEPRIYPIEPGDLRAGTNTLVVRVSDDKQAGGIVKGPVSIDAPGRWLDSYYLDRPAKLDDPYRYNRW